MEEMNVAALSDETGRMQLRGEREREGLPISAQGDCTRILNLRVTAPLVETESELNFLFKFELDQKTVNPLDPRRGNFDSTRGWVCFQKQTRNLIG